MTALTIFYEIFMRQHENTSGGKRRFDFFALSGFTRENWYV
jgi:hypothetical protein